MVPLTMKKIVERILAIAGITFEEFHKKRFLRVKNAGYMDLCIDYLGIENKCNKYAVAQNYIQNGDVMKDPDMQFYSIESLDQWWAGSFEQDGCPQISQFSILFDGENFRINRKLQKQQQSFSNVWSRNLHMQGFDTINKEAISFS